MNSPASGPRRVLDVSGLPTATFGHRSTVWWGTLGFMAAEGTTLAMAAWAYFYFMRNFTTWPPLTIPPPDVGVATVGLVLLLAMIPIMRRARDRALALDALGARRWLYLGAAVTTLAVVGRAFELEAVNVRWDDNAYGSAVWVLLGFHATLLIVDVLEALAMAATLGSEKRRPKHLTDVDDAAVYQYFLSLSWVPIYVMIYLLPRA